VLVATLTPCGRDYRAVAVKTARGMYRYCIQGACKIYRLLEIRHRRPCPDATDRYGDGSQRRLEPARATRRAGPCTLPTRECGFSSLRLPPQTHMDPLGSLDASGPPLSARRTRLVQTF